MPNEKEINPILDLKDIPLLGDPVKIKLDCAAPVKTGQGKFGEWYLWFGFVENAKVREGKERTPMPTPYTGKVIFFPTENLNKQLIQLTNGNIDVEVAIRKIVEEGRSGRLIKRYEAEKLSEGRKPDYESDGVSMTPTEMKLVKDTQAMLKSGYNINEDLFVEASQQPVYENSITKERAKELFKLLKG